MSEQFGDPNYSKVFWQTESGSETQRPLGTPLGAVVVDPFCHRFLRGCKVSFYHGPVLTASGNSVQHEAEGCMKPLVLMLVLSIPFL